MKNSIRFIVASLASVVLLLVVMGLVFCGNNRLLMERQKNDKVSFYYRDTLDVDAEYPEFSDYEVEISDTSMVQVGRKFYFPEPEKITVDQIHLSLSFVCRNDTVTHPVHVRCWKDGVCELEEVTGYPIISSSKGCYYYESLLRRFFHVGYDYTASLGDTTFVFKHGRVTMITPNERVRCGKFVIEDPVYVQVIRGGDDIYVRNKNKLFVTSDCFKHSRLVYDDRMGVRNSMIWDESSGRLLFSMYTPGEERLRHYLLAYDPVSEKLDTLQTFYTSDEHKAYGLEPFCRHIHLISRDPYSGDIYIGVGDYDGEAGIFRSTDGGVTIEKVGQGSQKWRTLAFYFTEDYVFWSSDSESPQYINRLSREVLIGTALDTTSISSFPAFNSAIWCSVKTNTGLYLAGSNSEGCFYDDYHRIYGIEFGPEGVPVVYNLIEEKSIPTKGSKMEFHQLFPVDITEDGLCSAYDSRTGYREFRLLTYLYK